MKTLFWALTFFMCKSSYCQQKKVYNTTIQKAEKVIITNNNYIDSNKYKSLAKLYILDCENVNDLVTVKDSVGNEVNNYFINRRMVFTIGNPDGEIVYNTDWELEFIYGFDSAYWELPKYLEFEKNKIRDSYTTISRDKKRIRFRASYFGANHKMTLIVLIPYFRNSQHVYHRIGKLF